MKVKVGIVKFGHVPHSNILKKTVQINFRINKKIFYKSSGVVFLHYFVGYKGTINIME